MSEHIVKAPHVPPFVTFVTSAVPMVFDNSLSYYEALCALWKWLQDDVVNVINNNATVTEDYIQLTNEMKEYMDNYFDNLDVQEEINNKLDQMAEDGTLQEIVADYLEAKVSWCFDTVADMKASTNLVNGSYARTLGFYTLNDGGGALYKITSTGTANELNIIAVGSLKAHLVYEKTMSLTQFGISHTDADVTDKFNTVAEICSENYIKLIIPAHTYTFDTLNTKSTDTYNYSYFIQLLSNMDIEGEDKYLSVLKIDESVMSYTSFFFNDTDDLKNISLKNFTIEQYYASGSNMSNANRSNLHGAFVNYGSISNVKIKDVVFKNCCGVNSLAFNNSESSNIIIENCEFDYHHVVDIDHYDRSVVYLECNHYVFRNNVVKGNFETLGGAECHGYYGICEGNYIEKCYTAIHIAPYYSDDKLSANIQVLNNTMIDNANNVVIWHNVNASATVGCSGLLISGNNIKRSGYVLNQLFWLSVGMHRAERYFGIGISDDASTTDKVFKNIIITNNSIVTDDYADYSQYVTVGIGWCSGISLVSKCDVSDVQIIGNYIYGQAGPGIATGLDSGATLYHTDNVIITNNLIVNCANGAQSQIPLKSPISLRYGLIDNMIIRNNTILQTDSNFTVWASIYNQTNADSIRNNLYCDHNIIKSVNSGGQFAIISDNLRNIIIDKGATAERPITANAGDQYYDTTLKKVIVYNGSSWVNVDGTAL